LFNSTNGLLFPGGDVSVYDDDPEQHSRTMTNITMAATFLVNLAIQAYDGGVYYQIWGLCRLVNPKYGT